MKKLIIGVACLLSAAGVALEKFPEGEYRGVGHYKDDQGKTEGYTVFISIKGDVVSSIYTWGEAGQTKQEEWTFAAKFDKNSFFPVVVEGGTVGHGYCYSVQCHYEVRVGEMTLEETLTFDNGKLYRLGSKVSDGRKVVWEEKLE